MIAVYIYALVINYSCSLAFQNDTELCETWRKNTQLTKFDEEKIKSSQVLLFDQQEKHMDFMFHTVQQ